MSGVNDNHSKFVATCGRIGFVVKGFIYAFIGGLCIKSATQTQHVDESPQGVFILLLGVGANGTGIAILIGLLVGLLIYALWRFWEGFTGQGSREENSRWKNFFRYRLSPIVSGIVYIAYSYYIIDLLRIRHSSESCFPLCWKDQLGTKILLFILALSFLIGSITQFIPGLFGTFKYDMSVERLNKNVFFKYLFLVLGHVGFIGRGSVFLLLTIFFFKVLFSDEIDFDESQSTMAQALNNIKDTLIGTIVLYVIGISLILYGLFAVLNVYYKVFPTVTRARSQTGDSENQ